MTAARIEILGVTVDAQMLDGAVDTIGGWIERREPHYVCITGVHGVIESQDDPDLRRILTQPEHALTKQYTALLAVDDTHLTFDESGIDALAEYAEQVNREVEDIGARRLHTVLETVLEDVSFGTGLGNIVVDRAMVTEKLQDIVEDEDLSKYVL